MKVTDESGDWHFNSIKVRLELSNNLVLPLPSTANFNSIKVRLELVIKNAVKVSQPISIP